MWGGDREKRKEYMCYNIIWDKTCCIIYLIVFKN